MCNCVLKMPWTVISSKIASVILELQKSEVVWSEDFLSILKPSEITKIKEKIQSKSSNYDDNSKILYFGSYYSIVCVFE